MTLLRDKDDFDRHHYWLRELYTGAMSDIPIVERTALAKAFVSYMDALLERNDEGEWNPSNMARVHEWAARALLNGDELVFEMVWQWVQVMIDTCKDNESLQASFSEGFIDDLRIEQDFESEQSDWSNPSVVKILDRIFRCLSDSSTQWVAFEAYDDDANALWEDLKKYIEHPLSAGYRGPASRAEIEAMVVERNRII